LAALDSPLFTTAALAAGAALACWLVSVLTGEHSWTDRLWSVMPPIYTAVYAASRDFADPRLDLMAALVLAWGARLTFNFARKGGYQKGGEDYRWAVLRARLTGWRWQAFNLLFVAGYQNFIVWVITLPAWAVMSVAPVPLGVLDFALAAVCSAALMLETAADQQQWNFHQAKKQGQASGFLTTGLFAFSRHPNFFFEQLQWWALACFPLAAGAPALGFYWLGALLLTLLFLGSTRFTESITLSKYPAYARYQAQVSAQLPWFPRRS
jgi:steroid 5-alpha reductase family enzyme